MSNETIPATRNEGWGFWGTMGGHASIAWPLAMQAIAAALHQRGRHFINGAIATAGDHRFNVQMQGFIDKPSGIALFPGHADVNINPFIA